VLFFVWGLCALLWALKRNTLRLLIAAGLLFGLALMTRPVMIHYLVILVPALAVALRLQGKNSAIRSTALAVVPAILILAFATPGLTGGERLSNFVKTNSTNAFMLLWVLAQAVLVLSRGVQLVGLVHGLREPAYRGATLILAATIVYFLVLTGPIASPKYRIPIEPPLLILFGMGWVWLRDRFSP